MLSLRAAGALAILLIPCPTRAQSWLSWQLFQVSPLVDVGHVWDRDGPGPGRPLFVFGGGVQSTPGGAAAWIATYDPKTGAFGTLGSGLTYEVDALTTAPNGDLIAAGGGGLLGFGVGSVDRWDGAAWSNLARTNGYVWSLTTMPNGDFVAGGDFTQVNGVAANHVARWDGSGWSPLGTGIDGRVLSLNITPAGELLASGWFSSAGGTPTEGGIVRWNGNAWMNLPPGSLVTPLLITAAIVLPNGDIVGGGAFLDPGTLMPVSVARWDGTGWQPLGAGTDGPAVSLTALPNGDLVAGGAFDQAGGVAANNIARWDGSAWSALGAGLGTGSTHQVISLTTLPNGDLMAGGAFDTVPTSTDRSLARLSTSLPATVTSYGVGCAGAAGAHVLTAVAAPWAGGTARFATTGTAPNWLGLSLWGFGRRSLPLPAVSPLGQVGCELLLLPSLALVSAATGTELTSQLAIPANPVFAGAVIDHQIALLETGAGGTLLNLTSSNALELTVGVF
ncbi:MAG: hypothetical protein AAF628_24710 [Planctomycetota bacterium]